jgi:Pathogenicity locus
MSKSDLILLPGIGKTFVKDFGRIGLVCLADFKGKDAQNLFELLRVANERDKHATSKNYLYVLRYVVYCAATPPGKRQPELMKWSAWKD